MNEKELRLKLKEMKQELLNLKIAHKRGLGVTSFYEKEASVVTDISFSGKAVYYIEIEFEETPESVTKPFFFLEYPYSLASRGWAFVEEYPDIREAFASVNYGSRTDYPAVFKCKIISTAPIAKFKVINVGD